MLQIVKQRLSGALMTWPNRNEWLAVGIVYAVYALGMIVFSGGDLQAVKFDHRVLYNPLVTGLYLFFVPALFEELGFRALLYPREDESIRPLYRLFWLLAGWALFVMWHPFQALTWSPDRTEFLDGMFLGLTTWFGLCASTAYLLTQSIWPAVLLHWVVVLFLIS